MKLVKCIYMTSICIFSLIYNSTVLAEEKPVTDKPIYGEYQDWKVIAISHRTDKKQMRVILGNETAISSARKGSINPWLDGTILTKVVWKEKTHTNWSQAVVVDSFEKAEAMVKDSKKYTQTGGWGFGFWEGNTLRMYDETKSKECFACHLPMQSNDYVYNAPIFQ